MKRKLAVLFFIILFVVSCSTVETGKVVEPDKTYDNNVEISCMQEALRDHMVFQERFRVDLNTPELTVFAKGEYAYLSDEDKEIELEAIGMEWLRCYKNDVRTLTIWLLTDDYTTLNVIFVDRSDYEGSL
jgi:hypothetical protein